MPTTSDYLTQLEQDREDLVDNLETKGITGLSGDETFTELIPEVLNIQSGGGTPTVGYVIKSWSNSGEPLEIETYGYTSPPDNLFTSAFPKVTKITFNDGFSSTVPYKQHDYTNIFQGCKELATIDLSNLTLKFQTNPDYFNGCSKLTNVDFSKINKYDMRAFKGCTLLTAQSNMPNDVTYISAGCFQNCTNLNFTSLPDSVTTIGGADGYEYRVTGGSTFAGCTNLALTKLPDSLTTFYYGYNHGGYDFQNCTSITVKKIPDGVTSLPYNTFEGCSSIPSMDLNNVTSVGQYVFKNCTSMASVVGDKVTTINNYAFIGCSAIETVSFNAVKTINIASFQNCSSLLSIALPVVTTISGNNISYATFNNCTSLKGVWVGSSITSAGFGRYVFSNCTAVRKIYIDLPRATVTTFANYQYAFSSTSASAQTLQPSVIVCNDDSDFITQAQFEAIDWENYS